MWMYLYCAFGIHRPTFHVRTHKNKTDSNERMQKKNENPYTHYTIVHTIEMRKMRNLGLLPSTKVEKTWIYIYMYLYIVYKNTYE